MQKIIFGIFAHPDDEAFGPSGTLIQEVKSGAELHLITLTAGEAGQNPDNHTDIASVRLQEWRRAGEIIGATTMHYLGYQDGQLDNISLPDVQQKILDTALEILKTKPKDIEIEFITMDLNGITGHIDHIVAARSASFVFYKLKELSHPVVQIKYACLPEHQAVNINTDWIFMESGRQPSEISQTVDVHEHKQDIIAVIKSHHTQRSDASLHLANKEDKLINYFIVRN